jgi:hypothetical protein
MPNLEMPGEALSKLRPCPVVSNLLKPFSSYKLGFLGGPNPRCSFPSIVTLWASDTVSCTCFLYISPTGTKSLHEPKISSM